MRLKTCFVLLALATGCDPQRDATVADAGASDPDLADEERAEDAGGGANTYSYLYDHYFGPNTPGHCGNAMCHSGDKPKGKWLCGSDKHTCYVGMTTLARTLSGRLLVDTAHPLQSAIIDPNDSPLIWVNTNGAMPFDNMHQAVPTAAGDIEEWLEEGGAREN
jgi:hypothetical protein